MASLHRQVFLSRSVPIRSAALFERRPSWSHCQSVIPIGTQSKAREERTSWASRPARFRGHAPTVPPGLRPALPPAHSRCIFDAGPGTHSLTVADGHAWQRQTPSTTQNAPPPHRRSSNLGDLRLATNHNSPRSWELAWRLLLTVTSGNDKLRQPREPPTAASTRLETLRLAVSSRTTTFRDLSHDQGTRAIRVLCGVRSARL
jgi:hypothetical protein